MPSIPLSNLTPHQVHVGVAADNTGYYLPIMQYYLFIYKLKALIDVSTVAKHVCIACSS